jgi:hypothetical protein
VIRHGGPVDKPIATEGPGMAKPTGNGGSNQSWRRPGREQQSTPNAAPPVSNQGQGRQTGNGNSDWRRSPGAGTPQRDSAPAGGNRQVTPNTDKRPAPAPQSNQQWRRSSEQAPRAMNSSTEAPASRDRFQREDPSPTPDRGSDWRRSAPSQNSAPRDSAPVAQRDSGNWRQSTARESERSYSRPPLDMRQPIVTPRSSGPSSSGGYRGGGGRSAPSGGGGGGHSAPSHSGGQSHSSGGGGTPHRGR